MNQNEANASSSEGGEAIIDLPLLQQIEQVCERFEDEASSGSDCQIETFLQGFEGAARAHLVTELVAIDLELRRGRGESPRETDYPQFDQVTIARLIQESRSPPGLDRFSGLQPGARLGSYTLLEKIGEGGMGTVFRAEQREPILREVAIKVIKGELASPDVISRFEQERRALAAMDHPHIARVLEVGESPAGLPFLVMELVRGEKITEYCETNALGLEDRLGLFLEVCYAVQHAHQKGVLHRDLKPSNVIVAKIDGRPAPKVIDFGLAKVLEPGESLALEQTPAWNGHGDFSIHGT